MANFGETLKRERELRKISLREVSEATKIGLRYLEAMEENRFDQLPGGVFSKGFIRAYAKFIGLDGETLVNVYLYDVAHQLNPAPARPRYAGMTPEDAPLPVETSPTPVRRFPVKLLTGIAATVFILAAGGWMIFTRLPAGAMIDSPPKVEEPPIQEAGLLRPAPANVQGPPEQDAAAVQQDTAPPLAEPPASAPPAAQEKAPSIETDLTLFLGTTQTTGIVVMCKGVEKVRRDLAEGETIAVMCSGEVLLSAGNAGALTLKINGHECLPLGELGATLEDFALNSRTVKEICPPEKDAH